jgi:hypothetical protein
MVSLWRQALEGQERCVKLLRSPLGKAMIAQYYETNPQLTQLGGGDPRRILAATRQIAEAFTSRLIRSLQKAEPIVVSDEIMRAIMTAPVSFETEEVYHPDRVPLREGFVWLEDWLGIAPPPDKKKWDEYISSQYSVFEHFRVRALSFGAVFQLAMNPRTGQVTEGGEISDLGIVAYGNHLPPGHPERDTFLLPFVIDTWRREESHLERLDRLVALHPERHDILLQVTPTLTLGRLWKYMSQRILVVAPTEPVGRKQYKLAARLDTKGTVQIIQWRRAEYARNPDHRSEHRDWSCWWTVKSHTRRYKSGKVVTVKSYVKGDRSKPFKYPNHTVHVVNR